MKKKRKRRRTRWQKNEEEREHDRWYIHIIITWGGDSKLKWNIVGHFQLPPFNFALFFIISNASHMLGLIKLKLSTNKKKKKTRRQVSHVEVRTEQKRRRWRRVGSFRWPTAWWRLPAVRVEFFVYSTLICAFFFFFVVFFFLNFETKPSTFDRFHGGWSFNNGDKVLWVSKILFSYKIKIVLFFFLEQIFCHPSLIELLFSKMI